MPTDVLGMMGQDESGGGYGPPPGGYGQPPGGYGHPPGGDGQPPGGFGPPGGYGGSGDYVADRVYGDLGSGGPADVGAVFSNFMTLVKRSGLTFTALWLALAAVELTLNLPSLLQLLVQGGAVDVGDAGKAFFFGTGMLCVSLANFAGLIVLAALKVALSRPMRASLVQGPEAVGGALGALKMAGSKIFPALGATLLVGLMVLAGLVVCVVPGFIVAFLFCMVPYLVVTRDELSFGGAFGESMRMAKLNAGPIILGIVLAVVVGLVLAGVNAGLAVVLVTNLREYGLFALSLSVFVIQVAVGLVSWLFWGAMYVSIETSDANVAIAA